MKNIKRKAFGVLSLSAVALALASCDAKRNTQTPTGDLKLEQNYATLTRDKLSLSVTYEEMYNKFRSNGYSDVVAKIKESVIRNQMKEATYAKNLKAYNEKILNAVYGTSKFDSFKDLLPSEKEDLEDKVDQFALSEANSYGTIITADEIASLKNLINTFATYENEDVKKALPFESSFIEKMVSQYSYNIALTNYARQFVEVNYNKEKIYSYSDKKEVTNNYKITDEDITNSFKSTYYKYNQTKAIVVRFKNLDEAEAYKSKIEEKMGKFSNDLSATEKRTWFVNLYNEYYKTRESLDADNPFDKDNEEETVFYNDANHSELNTKYSQDLEKFVYDALEDGEGIVNPRNIDGSYYLVYRDSVNYYYGDGTGADFDQAKNITEADLVNKFGSDLDYYKLTNYKGETSANLYEYIKSKLIEAKASESLGETLVLNQIKYNSTIEIYDPVYENQFKNSYSDYYNLTSNFDKNNIFKITTKFDNHTLGDTSDDVELGEFTYSVKDFFNKQVAIHSTEYATTMLEDKYLLQSGIDALLTNKDNDSLTESAKSQINEFNKGKTAYVANMGLNNYLTLTYGLTTHGNEQDALRDYLKAQSLRSSFNKYYGYFLTSTQDADLDTFVDDNNLFATLKKYTDKKQDEAYTFSANHIIIQVCPEVTGTTVDPRKYRNELSKKSDELAEKFDKAVNELTKLIVGEAKVITDKSVDALAKLVKTYNNSSYAYTLQTNEFGYTSWTDFKNAYPEFNFYLHSEDLSSITKASAESYVKEFKDYCAALAKLIAKNEKVDGKNIQDIIKDKGILIDPTSDSFKELGMCETSFGFHILNVYSYTANVSCKFTKEEDSQGSDASYKRWQHKEVIVNTMNPSDTSDDIIVYASGYSDSEYASVKQLFMYFFQSNSEEDILRSTTKSAISTYFGDVMNRYNSASFQDYRLLQQVFGFENLKNGTFTSIKFFNADGSEDATRTANYKNYVTKVRNAVDGSKELESTSPFSGWFDENWTVDLTKCEKYHYDVD